jgi:predicted transposase/invertase (TIGR01784 family)
LGIASARIIDCRSVAVLRSRTDTRYRGRIFGLFRKISRVVIHEYSSNISLRFGFRYANIFCEYSTALAEGGKYSELPRTIRISIVDFTMFDCAEFYSEFLSLEATRHTLLTDRMSMRYFELPKLPESANADDGLGLWLELFRANTEEELKKIEAKEVPVMNEAIEAYRSITATDEFKELERLRSLARHNEASALGHARDVERAKWQGVVREKDAVLAEKDALIEELQRKLKTAD